jgi:hypothetical protein
VKKLAFLTSALATCVASVVWAQGTLQTDDLQKRERELSNLRQQLFESQVQILQEQLDILKSRSPQSQAVLAMQSILDLKLSQERVRSALAGGRVIAEDGTYLGRIGPTYDSESIFCSYGPYGASYSTQSIWCSHGTYGASYNVQSPFCSYSTTPPKIIVDGSVVASLTVGTRGFPVSVSPNALKGIFEDK